MSKRRGGGGRKMRGPFTGLPDSLMDHEAVRSLSHGAHRLLFVMARQYRGANNGAIGIWQETRTANRFGNRNRFYRYLRELEQHGLIAETYPASRVPARPKMFALTWLPTDDTDYTTPGPASHAYQEWTAPPKKPRKRKSKKRKPKLRVVHP